MKKKILLFLTIIFFTGCTCDYNLTIDNKKRVYEDATFMDDNSNILKYDSSVQEFLYNRENEFYDYNSTRIYENDMSGLNVKRSYNSIDEYVQSSLYLRAFEKSYIVKDKDFYKFETSGQYYRNNIFSNSLESTFKYNIDKINIKIKFYNEVISSNADEIDKANNIYTWTIDKESLNESISFQLSNKVRFDVMFKDFIYRNKITLIVICGILVVVVFSLIKLRQVMKKNNSI